MCIKTLDAVFDHPYFCPLFSNACRINTCRIRVCETPPNCDPLPTVFAGGGR